jgi:hypothetical protein
VQYITVAAGGNFQMSYPLGDAVGLRVERIKTAAPAGWRAGAKPRDSCRISRLQLDERGPDALRSVLVLTFAVTVLSRPWRIVR